MNAPPGRPYTETIREAVRKGGGKGKPGDAAFNFAYGLAPYPGGKSDRLTWLEGLRSTLRDPRNVASCVPTAEQVNDDFGIENERSRSYRTAHQHVTTAMNPVDASEPPVRPHMALRSTLEQIRANQRGPAIMRYTHGAHSISLMAHGGGVEPMETWAEQEAPKMLSESLERPRSVGLDQAIEAAKNLGHEDKDVRSGALDTFSEATIGGFETVDKETGRPHYPTIGDVPVSLDVRDMHSQDEIARRTEARTAAMKKAMRSQKKLL